MANVRTLVVCVSVHHGNTRRIAGAMADVLDAEVLTPQEVEVGSLGEYELIGFGSGIYRWKHHATLLDFAGGLSPLTPGARPRTNAQSLLFLLSLGMILTSLKTSFRNCREEMS